MKEKKKVKKKNKKQKGILRNIFCYNNKFDIMALMKNILLPVAGAIIITLFTKNSMNTYDTLKKSIVTPPAIVFTIVWTILYTLMGIASYRIYMNNKAGKKDYDGYFYYIIQLLINFLWSIVFSNLRLYGISFILIILLLILIVITIVKFFKVDKIAGILMIPYILWVSFASYLSLYIWIFNEM